MRIFGVFVIIVGIIGLLVDDVLLGLFLLFLGFILCRAGNSKKHIDNKKSISEDKSGDVISNNEEKSTKENIREFTFRVAGITKEGRQDLIKELVDEWKELYPDEVYQGLSNKEILEYGEDVYEVDIFGYDEITLVPEPDNPYDTNAIKVIHEDVGMIGYVPKELTSKVKKFLDNNCEIEWRIVGGKFKYVDWGEDKVRTQTLTYGVEITLRYKK